MAVLHISSYKWYRVSHMRGDGEWKWVWMLLVLKDAKMPSKWAGTYAHHSLGWERLKAFLGWKYWLLLEKKALNPLFVALEGDNMEVAQRRSVCQIVASLCLLPSLSEDNKPTGFTGMFICLKKHRAEKQPINFETPHKEQVSLCFHSSLWLWYLQDCTCLISCLLLVTEVSLTAHSL